MVSERLYGALHLTGCWEYPMSKKEENLTDLLMHREIEFEIGEEDD
jgi:hypothetical protein